MLRRPSDLWRALWGTASPGNDGYGQSLLDDLRSAARFARLCKQRIDWRPSSEWPGDVIAEFPVLDRFGDGVVGWHAEGGEHWFVIDRLWHGFPDPPEFAFLAFDAEKRIVTGKDFHDWPKAWARPEALVWQGDAP